jgi:hypothetical protein
VRAEREVVRLYAAAASSIPFRVSGVPPDFEITIASVSAERSPSLGKSAVDAVGIGVVEEVRLQAVGRARERSATSCGPSAEPPIPITSRCRKRSRQAA